MNLKNHNIKSVFGYGIGLSFAFLSALRYFVLYPDMDKAIVYVTIGFLIAIVSYEYSAIWNLSNTLSYIEKQLQAKWETKRKIKRKRRIK